MAGEKLGAGNDVAPSPLQTRRRAGTTPSAVTAVSGGPSERPRNDCLFPPLASAPSAGSRDVPGAGEDIGELREGGSKLSRSEPYLPRPPESVLSAVSTSFVPLAPPGTSSVAASQPPLQDSPSLDWAAREPTPHPVPQPPGSKVSGSPPAPAMGRRSRGNAAAMLPYAASEISSIQSGWRQHYWQVPSVNFQRGLLSQDVRYATESSHCKCVVPEAALPPMPKYSPQELHNAHRIKWLDSMIRKEKETLRRPPRSMSEVNANVFTDKQLDHHPWSHHWLPAKATNAAKKEAKSRSASATKWPVH
eukprot:TRINITY_DN20773_c0_g1_i1.p1 TRINITY_DN20773_c0_g1~~TRINITY_DN20773_c0_g1_i1.p1  ORF type:complete len:313 (+),score=60.09 TRINITY_DN20773_c0_g1_i1:25-939(+)